MKTLNKELKRDIQSVLRKHKVKGMRIHLKHMEGSGLFDKVMKVGKKAVELGKKGYEFYNKNKDTIHKVADAVAEHAPTVIDYIKKMREKKGGRSVGGRRVGGKHRSSSASEKKERLGGKRVLPPALRKWQEECKAYAKKHGVTYRQAMTALKKH